MKKIIKTLGIFIAAVLLLLIVGLFALTRWVNPNQFKPIIETIIQKNTGRSLTINGDLHWSFFPWLNIQIDHMLLSNPSNFSLAEPFLSVKQAHVRLKLLPLLVGHVAFNKLILQNATLNLVVMPSGENNWQINEMPSTVVHRSAVQTTKKNVPSSTATWQRFSFHDIEFQNGTIHWRNQQINREITFSNVNFKARHVKLKQKFPINFSMIVHPYHLPYSFNLAIHSNCYVDLASQQYNLSQFSLNGTISSSKTSNFKQIPFKLKGDLDLNLNEGSLEFENFSGKLANAEFKANLNGEKIIKSPVLKMQIKILPFDLQELFQRLSMPLHLPTKKSLRKVASKFSFEFSPKFFRVTNLQMMIDKTNIIGEVDFTKFDTNTIQLDLKIDKIDLDRYLPLSFQKTLIESKPSTVGSSFSSKTKRTEKSLAIKKDQLPNWLRNFDLKGQIHLQQLRYRRLLFNQLNINFNDEPNKIIDASIHAKFYQGNLSTQLILDTTQPTFLVRENTRLSHVQLKNLLQDLTGRLLASGQLQLTHQSSTQGNSLAKWIKNLSGNGSLSIEKGEIYGIDFPSLLQKGLQFLKKHADIIPNINESTHFSAITATYRIRKGVLYNKDLRLKSSQLNIEGSGQINFVKQQLNYRLNLIKKNHVKIPVLMTGSLFNPTIRIDASKLIQYTVQHQLARPLDELKNTSKKAGRWFKQKIFSAS